jgi:hypothetical protein
MDALNVESPAFQLSDLIKALVKYKDFESGSPHGPKNRSGQSATRRGDDLLVHSLVQGNIAYILFARNPLDDRAIFLDAPQTLGLHRKLATSPVRLALLFCSLACSRFAGHFLQTIWAMASVEGASKVHKSAA